MDDPLNPICPGTPANRSTLVGAKGPHGLTAVPSIRQTLAHVCLLPITALRRVPAIHRQHRPLNPRVSLKPSIPEIRPRVKCDQTRTTSAVRTAPRAPDRLHIEQPERVHPEVSKTLVRAARCTVDPESVLATTADPRRIETAPPSCFSSTPGSGPPSSVICAVRTSTSRTTDSVSSARDARSGFCPSAPRRPRHSGATMPPAIP